MAAQVAPLREQMAAEAEKNLVLHKRMLRATAWSGDAGMVHALLEHTNMPVDYPANPHNGATLLDVASGAGHLVVVEQLIDLGADVNTVRTAAVAGVTPLYSASHGGHAEVVEVLLGQGADPDKALTDRGGGGETPLRVAMRKGHQAIVDILSRHAAGN